MNSLRRVNLTPEIVGGLLVISDFGGPAPDLVSRIFVIMFV